MLRGKRETVPLAEILLREEIASGLPLKNQSRLISRRQPVNLTADSPRLFKQIRQWLDFCLTHHYDCGSVHILSEYPRRLLEVAKENGSHVLRIWTRPSGTEADDPGHVDYLTLSHCWGKSKARERARKITTTINLKDRMTLISFKRLPRTYRDAIKITRELGERFLWIDSLCILQDSESDWAEESAHMGEIYSKSLLTISADSASNSKAGILRHRVHGPGSLEIPFEPNPAVDVDDQGIFNAYILPLHSVVPDWKDSFNSSVLRTRGWALQEHQLSQRVIHYISEQVLWECRCNASEAYPLDILDDTSVFREYSSAAMAIGPYLHHRLCIGVVLRELKDLYSSFSKHNAVLSQWYDLVNDYSSRTLTYETDRLPAISGIVKNVLEKTPPER